MTGKWRIDHQTPDPASSRWQKMLKITAKTDTKTGKKSAPIFADGAPNFRPGEISGATWSNIEFRSKIDF